MRHLMRDDGMDSLTITLGRDLWIEQQFVFEIKDRAPILHCAKKLRRSRTRYHVEFGKRIGLTKIIIVITEQSARRCQRIVPLINHALATDHADLRFPDLDRLSVDITYA